MKAVHFFGTLTHRHGVTSQKTSTHMSSCMVLQLLPSQVQSARL